MTPARFLGWCVIVSLVACGRRSDEPDLVRFDDSRVILRKPFGASAMIARFPYRNDGDTAVHLVRVERGCGCMSVDPSTFEQVPPGGTSTLLVTVDTRRFTRPDAKPLVAEVASEGGRRQRIALTIAVEPLASVSLDPIGLAWVAPLSPEAKRIVVTVTPPEAVSSVSWSVSAAGEFTIADQGGGHGRWEAEVSPTAATVAETGRAGQRRGSDLEVHLRAPDGSEELRTARLVIAP
jgi:hypothetical protein